MKVTRYANRKLYANKRYVLITEVHDAVRRGEIVSIVEHKTGRDLTALILARSIGYKKQAVPTSYSKNDVATFISE